MTSNVFASDTWEERQAKIKAIIDAEVQRKHELEIEKAKIEVLRLLQESQASNISINTVAINRNDMLQELRSTNENST